MGRLQGPRRQAGRRRGEQVEGAGEAGAGEEQGEAWRSHRGRRSKLDGWGIRRPS